MFLFNIWYYTVSPGVWLLGCSLNALTLNHCIMNESELFVVYFFYLAN